VTAWPRRLLICLAKIPSLKVSARTSAFSFKGKEVTVAQIAQTLGVQHVLEGSVRKGGNRVRITVQLIDTADGFHLWSERFDRELWDIFAVQDEIALAVTEALKVKLLGENREIVLKRHTNSAEAHEAYLKGRFFWNKFTLSGFQKALDFFHQAITMDPNYAPAFAGIADAFTMLSEFGGMPPSEALQKGKEAALKALSLDDNLSEANCALGMVLMDHEFDFKAADRHFRRALKLNPNNASAHLYFAQFSALQGAHDVASPAFLKALDLDPLSVSGNWIYGYGLYEARKFDEALLQTLKAIEMDPAFPLTRLTLAGIYQMQGDYTSSVDAMGQFFDLMGDSAGVALVRDSFAHAGWKGYLRAMAADRRAREHAFLGPAIFYASLGELEAAIDALEDGYKSRASYVVGMNSDPRLGPLRSESAY
jgi:adenylate cyclase